MSYALTAPFELNGKVRLRKHLAKDPQATDTITYTITALRLDENGWSLQFAEYPGEERVWVPAAAFEEVVNDSVDQLLRQINLQRVNMVTDHIRRN